MALFDSLRRKKVKQEINIDDDKIIKGRKELEIIINDFGKKTGVNLSKHLARVAVVMDHSSSMIPLYEDGTVQQVLNMILPFALQFDNNGQLEVFLFDNVCMKMDTEMNAENYKDYVKEHIIKKNYSYGGTRYEPAVKKTDMYYNDKESGKIPTIVFFITDGDNFLEDRKPCNAAILESSSHGIFYAIIGVGNSSFSYLKELDDLRGRKYDNTGFMQFSDFKGISNVTMFTNALKDYIPWLKAKGYVR